MAVAAVRSWRTVTVGYLLTWVLGGIVWQAIYRSLGMNLYTQVACLAMLGCLGYMAMRRERLSLRSVGAGWENLLRAVLVLAIAHAVFLGILLVLQSLGLADAPLVKVPRWRPVVLSWGAVGVGEELFFRAFLLVALCRLLDRGRTPWRAVLLGGVLFSLYHVPLEVAFGVKGGELLIQLLLPFVTSVLVLGPLYILSRNFWLVALLHGIIDYPIMPAIKDNPALGLLFMVMVMLLGRFLLRPSAPLPLVRTEDPDRGGTEGVA